jgi:hypothetical protein
MPYIGPYLPNLIATDSGFIAGQMIVDDAMDYWHGMTARNTPVRTGNLRTSWYRVPSQGADRTRRYGYPAYVAHLRTDVPYGPHVEWNTRPHIIRPVRAKALRFVAKDGTVVFASMVRHPGTTGAHMMAIGAHLTEQNLDDIAEDGLRLWARLTEAKLGSG